MKKIIIGNNKDTKTLAVELAIKCNIPIVIVPKGTLVCDECNGEAYEEQGSLYECPKCESTNSD